MEQLAKEPCHCCLAGARVAQEDKVERVRDSCRSRQLQVAHDLRIHVDGLGLDSLEADHAEELIHERADCEAAGRRALECNPARMRVAAVLVYRRRRCCTARSTCR